MTHIIDFDTAFSIHARVSIADPGSRSALQAPPREAQNPWIIEASQDLPERRPPTMYSTLCGVIGTIGRTPASSATIPNRGSTKVRSEEHTSELQSRGHLVCRLLLEKKKNFDV